MPLVITRRILSRTCSPGPPPLLRLDPGLARASYPFFDIGMHQSREFVRAVAGRLQALFGEEFFDFGGLQWIHDGLVELVDDRPRRVGRGEDAVPARHFVIGHAGLRDGRYVLRDREALGGTDAERPHGSGADLR